MRRLRDKRSVLLMSSPPSFRRPDSVVHSERMLYLSSRIHAHTATDTTHRVASHPNLRRIDGRLTLPRVERGKAGHDILYETRRDPRVQTLELASDPVQRHRLKLPEVQVATVG